MEGTMPRYTITASVTVDVEMSIEAETPAEARRIFKDQICLVASLTDLSEESYDTIEDSISDIQDMQTVAQ
jgi:hypothetical protein